MAPSIYTGPLLLQLRKRPPVSLGIPEIILFAIDSRRAPPAAPSSQHRSCRTNQNMRSFVRSAQLTFYTWGRILKQNPASHLTRCLRNAGSLSGHLSARRCSSSSPPSSHSKVLAARVWNLKEAEAVNAFERRSVDFSPGMSGDDFLEYASTDSRMVNNKAMERIKELKSEVKRMFASDAHAEPSKRLNLIDQIQRLGIAYQFDREIKESLEQVRVRFLKSGCADNDDDLHMTALRFRLLRQHGCRIPSSVFDKFKDREGNFHASLINDVKGLLSLYEASHCRVRGEETLEEALNFCISHLKPMEEKSLEVNHALKQCIHHGVPRLEARRYIENYQSDDSLDEALLNLAKLDFNWTQKQHQREVLEIARWWKELDFRRKLPFARDRVVECYFWILGVYFEPEYSLARKILTKVLAMISIIDDIYDIYGTAEELELFTEAVERWHVDALDALPGYMQVCYRALLDIYHEIEGTLADQGRLYYVHYAKEAMKIIVRGYFKESKWLHQQHIPTVEEYMDVARVTAAYRTLTITSLVGLQDTTTKDIFEWLLNEPKILKASATACRIMDDIASHKFEQERGHIPSAVECYMKEYRVEEQQAENELKKRVDDAWMDINEECLCLTKVPNHVLARIVNLTRMLNVVYKDGDCYTHSETKLKGIISSLLIHPVAV